MTITSCVAPFASEVSAALCSSCPSSSSQATKFKFSASCPHTFARFDGAFFKPSSSSSAIANTSSSDIPVIDGTVPDVSRVCKSHGRRELLFMSTTLPFLFPWVNNTEGFVADADELPDYLLMREEIRKVLSKGKAAGVLRLVFHDAGTFQSKDKSGGMNGSIMYELDRPENKGLKKSLKIVEKAKTVVEARQPVSLADMISVAGAEAVLLCGGPAITVRLGRLDSMAPDLEDRLPEETLSAPDLKQCFQSKGFSTKELVALSGAHTLGSKGFGSPTTFDNSYFKILLEKPWASSAGMSSMIGLPSDRALVEDEECLRWITTYADDEDRFFQDFKDAYIKLVNTGARWKTSY